MRRYGCAVVSISVAIGARLLLDPILDDKFPFATVFCGVMVTSWYSGFGPAVGAALLGALASARFLLPPRGSFTIDGFDNQAGMALYLATSFGIALLGGAMRNAQRRAESKAQELLLKRDEIEKALQERLQAEEKLRVTLQSIGDAVISTDVEGRITFLNPIAATLTGWNLGEAQGKPLHEVFTIVNDQTREPVEIPRSERSRKGWSLGWRTTRFSFPGTAKSNRLTILPHRFEMPREK